jgi:hypothetical protein
MAWSCLVFDCSCPSQAVWNDVNANGISTLDTRCMSNTIFLVAAYLMSYSTEASNLPATGRKPQHIYDILDASFLCAILHFESKQWLWILAYGCQYVAFCAPLGFQTDVLRPNFF